MTIGETDLSRLLRTLEPELLPTEYVFVTLPPAQATAFDAVVRMHEAEGTTLIMERTQAEQHALPFTYPCRQITLKVHSSLEAVGMLARITTALAADGISVNPVAGYYHDHLFVPTALADHAITVLQQLAANS